MAIQTNKTDKVSRFIGMILLVFLLIALGSVACKKADEGAIGEEANEALAIELLQNENILVNIDVRGSTNFNDWSIGSLI